MIGRKHKQIARDSRLNGCMEDAIVTLYERHAEVSEICPMLGTGVLVVVAAAEDLLRARKQSLDILRQNHHSAQLRKANEQLLVRGTLEERLLKDPVKTVSELRSSHRGCMELIELWSGLGSTLLKKEGWNEMEIKVACSLLGVNHQIRCSREWTKLDRSMSADKARPYQALELNLQSQLRQYARDFSERMNELYPDEKSAYAVGLCMMQEWRLGLEYRLEENLYYDLKAYEKWRTDEINSRKYWVDTRRFIAVKIRELRREANRLMNLTETSTVPAVLLKYTSQELKLSEWSRKMEVSSISNFQKSMAMAKSIGLLGDGKARKTPKSDSISNQQVDLPTDFAMVDSSEDKVVDQADASEQKATKARSRPLAHKAKVVKQSKCQLQRAHGSGFLGEPMMNPGFKRITSRAKPESTTSLYERTESQETLKKPVSNPSAFTESGVIFKPELRNRLAEEGWKRQTGANDETEDRQLPKPESQ